MKIGILADCHLGASKYRKMIGQQNAYCYLNNETFLEAMDKFSKLNIDILIIAGDLFDYPNPDVISLKIAKEGLNKLNKPIYLLGGNHDFSQRNKCMLCHPFDLLDVKNLYNIYDECKIFNFDDVEITFIPYKFLNADSYGKIFRGDLKDRKKFSILAIHGYVNLGSRENDEIYSLPNKIAENYNFTICGHIHIPNCLKTKNISILTPGSLMPSNQADNDTPNPKIWTLDTDNGKLESIDLETPPKVIKIFTREINSALKNICNEKRMNLHFIEYSGSGHDIDEYLYKKALEKSLNIAISTNDIHKNEEIKKVTDFWTFINENHPDWEDEFKNILNES